MNGRVVDAEVTFLEKSDPAQLIEYFDKLPNEKLLNFINELEEPVPFHLNGFNNAIEILDSPLFMFLIFFQP